MIPTCGRKTVALTDIPERLSDTPRLVRHLEIVALVGNQGIIWIGGEAVSAIAGEEKGMPLKADEALTLPPGEDWSIDLQDLWVAADTAAEGVTWLALSANR